MRRSRLLAVFVLALLGAPVALHVVLHDLQEHHGTEAESGINTTGHGDHEHPVVNSAPPAALRLVRTTLPVVHLAPPQPNAGRTASNAERNVLSFGALRTDDDVGLHALLSTFLI